MTMLEKAAKASYEAGGDAGIRMQPWESIPAHNPLKANRLRDVRAVLKALRPYFQSMDMVRAVAKSVHMDQFNAQEQAHTVGLEHTPEWLKSSNQPRRSTV